MDKIKEIIKKMTLEDKIKLCSGASFWKTERMDQYGIPSLFMSDGPHGLRVQKGEGDHLGVNKSEKSTCFPTASSNSSTWNTQLIKEMGEAIGIEALAYDSDVVLGPGANIKRNPLCGRNFEYFSEDPYLTGQLSKSWIEGLQSKGVAASLKHFAGNNQEKDRLISNSMIDERALREIYLAGFELAVKEAQPETIMCSYNLINGIYSSDHKTLLTDILRKEWGFKGTVVTDWGAMNSREEGFRAGCDLEMPSSNGMFDEEVKEAVKEGRLLESDIDASVERIINLALKMKRAKDQSDIDAFDKEAHHDLAKKIAREGGVLLKNEMDILPLKKGEKIALCGEMADTIRYQGAGSSHINPTSLSSLKTKMEELGSDLSYYPSYEIDGKRNKDKLQDAIKGASSADKVVVVIGLPDSFESEGYDRLHMKLPQSHNELVEKISQVNDNIIIILMAGAPVEMPWITNVKGILNLYLAGQAVGEAGAELLYGIENPSGKLAETYPISYNDCSSSETFGINPRQVTYAESIYVGYRYYEKANIKVQFPFGHGLSYTKFSYSNIQINSKELIFDGKNKSEIEVSCKVKNVGKVAGAEVVQLYVGDSSNGIFKALKELKGFKKVYLLPDQEKCLKFKLDKRSFAHYDIKTNDWEVLSGKYKIYIGSSSQDIRLDETLTVMGTVEQLAYIEVPEWYLNPDGKPNDMDFEKIYGHCIKPYKMEGPGEYTLLNTLNDMKDNPFVQQIMEGMKANILQSEGADENDPDVIFTLSIVFNTPLIRLVQQGGGATPKEVMELAVASANGNV